MLQTVRTDISKWWGNGLRPLLIAFLVFLATFFLFASISVAAIFIVNSDETFSPLRNEVPQIVFTPVVEVGGVVIVQGTKCNDSNEAVSSNGETNIRDVVNGNLYPFRTGSGVRDPGCFTRTYENQLPPEIPPGTYRMEGFDLTVSHSGDVQSEPHFSQPFEVVEGD